MYHNVFIHSSMDGDLSYPFLTIMPSAAWASLCVGVFPFLLGAYLGVEFLGHVVNSAFNNLKNFQTAFQSDVTFYNPTNNVRGFASLSGCSQ